MKRITCAALAAVLLLGFAGISTAQITDRLNGIQTGLAIKAPVQAVTSANITLSGEQTVNGVAVTSGDRVLVKDQTTASENGIYVVSNSGWTRATDFDGNRDVADGTLVTVQATVGSNIFYQVDATNPVVIGTSAISFIAINDPNISYDLTADEIAAGLDTGDISDGYEPGNIRRYGGLPDDTSSGAKTANSAAFNTAVSAFCNSGVTLRIDGGDYHFGDQLIVKHPTSSTACRLNIWQDASARLYSYVTGSVDEATFDTAGFGVLIDGWKESAWYNMKLDYSNGTAGVVLRARNQSTVFNDFFAPTIRGGTVLTDRETRTKISWRVIGNESVSGTTGYVSYWNIIHGGYFDIAAKHMEMVVGDGNAATQQPNAQKVIGTQFERYLVAFDADDTDEHYINGAWASNATTISLGSASSVTQAGGTVTVTLAGHGLQTDDVIQIAGANESAYNGMTRITRVDANDFTYTKTNGVAVPSGTTSPATGTITATHYSVFFQGDSTFSQLGLQNESLGIGYFIEDGGSGGNLIQLVDNVSAGNSVIEDLTEQNTILDRQYYSASGQWTARIGTTDILEMTTTEATFNVPVHAATFRPDQVAVASATNITYVDTAEVWRITGTTTINTITDPGDGSPNLTLIFNASLTVNDDGTSAGNIKLDGGSDLSATANDVLLLVWDKTGSQWLERSRSVN